MNRTLLFGIVMFLAIIGLSLVGGDNVAQANHGCSCSSDYVGSHCCGLLERIRARREARCDCRGRHECRGGCHARRMCRGCAGRACRGCAGGTAPEAAPVDDGVEAPVAMIFKRSHLVLLPINFRR
jgi:hypothetical protein